MCLWVVGGACLGLFFALLTQQRANAQEAVVQFYADRSSGSFEHVVGRVMSGADQSQWSEERIGAYENADVGADDALAILRIPRLSLEAPVFEGASDQELARGPGWIRGTAPIGAENNVAIAGHRDGFFRALKNIAEGDVIEIVGRSSGRRYRVTDTWIVDPDAVHVLDSTPNATLTLVTCYPFYYVGHAPRRFIVRATEESA